MSPWLVYGLKATVSLETFRRETGWGYLKILLYLHLNKMALPLKDRQINTRKQSVTKVLILSA